MKPSILLSAPLLCALLMPVAANAQAGDAQSSPTASSRPQRISPDQQPRFRQYVIQRQHPSFTYSSPIVVGGVLPEAGVTYYEVPNEYGMTSHRYTIINDKPVLVDPSTRTIIQVIED
ncbi:DUF1236 domain-containing protein [Phreatobacter stygius]|uniref:DUF1236 domain-containing protein n=1 Tax=Phreatobacter stygius TaxID=1940610 RepID=A0A4D7B6E1_9HYPH|nr:DUF1236 domain-containing protein [Phreatobacter stygius]QCI63547.1 DUF1236 domain-containing protein [Phreatobacter stygius]